MFDHIVPEVQVPKLIESFSQGGEGQPRAQEQKALDESFVSRHGNLPESLCRRGTYVAFDLGQG